MESEGRREQVVLTGPPLTAHSPMEDAIPPPSKEPVPIRSKTPIESYSAPPSASEGVLIDVGEVPSTSRASRQPGLIEDDLDRQLEDMINRAALPRTTGSGVSCGGCVDRDLDANHTDFSLSHKSWPRYSRLIRKSMANTRKSSTPFSAPILTGCM